MILDKPEIEKPVSELLFQVTNSNALVGNSNFEYRYVSVPLKCILIVYDDERCLIETSTEHDVYVTPFIWTNNPVLVALSKSYFEKVWNSAINPKQTTQNVTNKAKLNENNSTFTKTKIA